MKCEKDKAFGKNFCKAVFEALDEDEDEDKWTKYCPWAITYIGQCRCSDMSRIKDRFIGKRKS
jgi:hypothetical protein